MLERRWVLPVLALLLVAGCSGGDGSDDSDSGKTVADSGVHDANGSGSDTGGTGGVDAMSDASPSGDTRSNGGSDAETDTSSSPGDTGGGSFCPTDTLPSKTTVNYDGSTVGNDNLFESSRLEWGPAGDDALKYVVPEAGTYKFSMENNLTNNSGCGISIADKDKTFWDLSVCPTMGQVKKLPDGFFVAGEGHEGTADLSANQTLLVLISCATWSMPKKEVDYSITIEKQ